MKTDSEVQREHFNLISSKYLNSRKNKNHLAYKEIWWNNILDFLLANYSFDEKNNSLEAMCGLAEGSNLLRKAYPKLKLFAFDYSDEMVLAAQQENVGFEKIFQADVINFSEKNKYDIVIILGGLHHVPNFVDKVLTNIYQSLRKDGIFINLEPTHNNFLFKYIRESVYKKNSLFEENTERGFTLSEYNEKLVNAGFRLKKQFFPGLIGYILYYNPDAFPFLNIGTSLIAKIFSKLDWFLGNTIIGRKFSFATWSIAYKK
ncbi:class I SAM-dependent methyltransferase [Leptospira terpstrae]|uniref:class I SAM-dependent methyltransferase n=1 Tax=Leptospira terpstrae TaxID=293075 RepID=UPI003D01F243